ncbi:helix-turn-helix transcriptional regulator [Rhizobium leguminosarum]|uniref:helix-turn-helix transcriptional regulator n=1 Tax=Rhizobium leguminosarum TaxID=384 RepID=UPI001C981E31|nr:AraC family transcriptional regulator [Rhizobium leguminosarum]
MTVHHLGDFVLSSKTFEPMRYEIGPLAIRRAALDHCVISVNRGGSSVMEADGVILSTPAGAISVRSLATPLRGEAVAQNMMFLYVPRELFPERASAFDAAMIHGLRPPLGSLLKDFLVSLERQLPFITVKDLPGLCEATKSVLKCCVAPEPDAVEGAIGPLSATLAERARRHIRANLRSRTLCADELSVLLRISRSQLYRLFKHNGVASEIRSQRLLASHRTLSDAASRTPIYAIAEEFCFSSPEEFAKAFRREFGYSPSDARGKRPPSGRTGDGMIPRGELGEWLLTLAG